jgi:hypothetical protein
VPDASGTLPLLESANTFTQNQTLDGTNNVAPNQTAASGSSIMTRHLTRLADINRMIYRVSPQIAGQAGTSSVLVSGGVNQSSTPAPVVVQCGATLNAYATLRIGSFLNMSPGARETIDFSRKFLLHGLGQSALTGTLAEGRTIWPVGGTAYTNGPLTGKGFGWLQVGSSLFGQTHDGTTLRSTISVTRTHVHNDHLAIYGDGAGNYSFYRNGALIETIVGPTGTLGVTQPVIACSAENKNAGDNIFVVWHSLEFVSWS